jgi:hypothetical protein
MLRGAAVTQLQPLKLLEKILQHTRHKKAGIEPAFLQKTIVTLVLSCWLKVR